MVNGKSLAQVIFALSTSEMTEEISLKPEAWRVLTHVNGARSIGEIAAAIRMPEPAVSEIADTLYRAGVLEIAPGSPPPPGTPLDSAFFDQATRHFTRAIGPMAEIIMDEEIAALGETREHFPRERAAEWIERLSDSIRDETRRLEFQAALLEIIRKM